MITGDIADPRRLGRPFVAALRPSLEMAETAQAQVRALGLSVDDVTDVAVTHLDLDHAGSATSPRPGSTSSATSWTRPGIRHCGRRARYVGAQWAHGPLWVRHDVSGDDWFGFKAVRAIADDVLLVPLRGHTRGHCGVAVRRPGGGWLLHAGDSYFSTGEKQTPPSAPGGLRAFQRLVAVDNLQWLHNQERLRELHAARGTDVTIFSAHDPAEYAALAHR